jgi:hypothetical protein
MVRHGIVPGGRLTAQNGTDPPRMELAVGIANRNFHIVFDLRYFGDLGGMVNIGCN